MNVAVTENLERHEVCFLSFFHRERKGQKDSDEHENRGIQQESCAAAGSLSLCLHAYVKGISIRWPKCIRFPADWGVL